MNEASYTYSLDQVFINVFQSDLYKRSKYGITYPYIFPDNKEIPDKIPTITIANFTEIDGGPYPVFVAGADPHLRRRDDLGQEPPHVQGRRRVRVLGRGRLRPDQRAADSGQHQQPERPVPVHQQRDRRAPALAIADAAMGLFTNYAEIGQRALTKWRALATDIFIQDSWRPREQPDDRRRRALRRCGRRSTRSTNNIATFNPAYYSSGQPGGASIRPPDASSAGRATTASCCPGDGFPARTRATSPSTTIRR